jgi:hypothetical protein
MRRAVYCPTGCGSRSFSAVRQAAIAEYFEIDEDTGEIVSDGKTAEGGGHLTLRCECGHAWRSRRDLNLALFLEER